MEDSFFGFDTSAPVEDDGGGGRRDGEEEEEYDALNDETFGAAINGDWENIHETLVKLDGHNGSDSKDEDEGSDLEINLSGVKLDDVDIGSDDNESRIQLDPRVWATPYKPEVQQNISNNGYPNPEAFLRRHLRHPFDSMQQHQQQQHQAMQTQQQQHQNRMFGLPPAPNIPPKICTVEDIERNIRNQQMRTGTPKPTTPLPNMQPPISAPNVSGFNRPSAPPGFSAPRMNFNAPPHPMNMHQGSQAGHRGPPGFPQMPMMSGPHGLPGPPHPNFPRNMSHNLPIALNNFAMHPNFNAMRPMGPPMISPRLPMQPNMMQGMPATNAVNQFNQRLVQEIQQNHPMLGNNRGMNHGYNNSNYPHNPYMQGYQHQQKNHGKVNMRSNGNVEEFDEYSNLMSARDKHWLIGIQLSQLNTETPYIDDYYYTVLKERRAKLRGDSQSKAHKDNQLNHPLIQPKGHAQLVLISMGKNGANIRNGQNRERKNSETKADKEPIIRTHTPLQFENSLGKLQYGSVTAPRKIIDMDVMGSDSSPQFNTSIELSAQRKSRQLLLHIETVYRIILKLEDLENPAAIATFAVVRERKEKEKQQALELAMIEAANRAGKDSDKADSAGNSVNSSISDKNSYEIESRDKLLQKLLPLISTEKVALMMNVRKGKALIRRIMPFIEDNPVRWNVWCGVFMSLQNVLKKDKDDGDGLLFALYPHFKKQIVEADLSDVIKIANSMPLNDKRVNVLFACKFCISSLFALLLRAEQIYATTSDPDIASNKEWPQFLSTLSASLSRTVQHQTISAAIESDAIQPMVHHFSRFETLKLESLLALFSQAKQQVN